MWYLFNKQRGEYITSTIKLKNDGRYDLYYAKEPVGCRWATEKGAKACIERIRGSLKEGEEIVAVYVDR